MRTNWIPWGLSALLLAGVVAGLVVNRRTDTLADSLPVEASGEKAAKLPEFDCRDHTPGPYEISAEMRDRHVAWLVEKLELSESQANNMNAVFANASIAADDFWRDTRDRYCGLLDTFNVDIRSVLDEKQLSVLERLKKEKRERRRRDGEHLAGPTYRAINEDLGKQP